MPKVKGVVSVTIRLGVEASSPEAWNKVIDDIVRGAMFSHISIGGVGPVNKRGDVASHQINFGSVAQQKMFKRRYKIKVRG
jgi:hypothetical protein